MKWQNARTTPASDLRMLAVRRAHAANTRSQTAVAISRLLNGPIRHPRSRRQALNLKFGQCRTVTHFSDHPIRRRRTSPSIPEQPIRLRIVDCGMRNVKAACAALACSPGAPGLRRVVRSKSLCGVDNSPESPGPCSRNFGVGRECSCHAGGNGCIVKVGGGFSTAVNAAVAAVAPRAFSATAAKRYPLLRAEFRPANGGRHGRRPYYVYSRSFH